MSHHESLQAIWDAHGEMTRQRVVEAAADPANPMHPEFTWDDSVAGPKYREVEAGRLIARDWITYREATDSEAERKVRAWHAMRQPAVGHYVPAEQVASDPFATKLRLAQMERDWRTFQRRWGHFAEFAELLRGELAETGS